jgi:hypothetical protein
VKLPPGTLLYKGTSDPWDPLTGPSVFTEIGLEKNKYKWFSVNPNTAEIYGGFREDSQGGSIWVYELVRPTCVIKMYDRENPTIAFTSLSVLDEVITKNHHDFDNDKDNSWWHKLKIDIHPKDACLKLPFGIIHNHEQRRMLKKQVPPDLAVNNLQRISAHNADKYLVLFMEEYRKSFLDTYISRKSVYEQNMIKHCMHDPKYGMIGLNGYIATEWKSDWHIGGWFHDELCLFVTEYTDILNTESPIQFLGRYKLDSIGNRYLVKAPHPKFVFKPRSTDFSFSPGHEGPVRFNTEGQPIDCKLAVNTKIDEVRTYCLPDIIKQGGKIAKKKQPKNNKYKVDDDDSLFGITNKGLTERQIKIKRKQLCLVSE